MSRAAVRVDGVMVLAGLIVGGFGYLYYKRGALVAAVNPADRNNLANQAVIAVAGEDNYISASDRIFGALDLLNPFNESDDYAAKVWGISKK